MKKENVQSIIVNIVYLVALIVVMLPLLILAHYSVPVADDWVYGGYAKEILQNGGNIFDVIINAFRLTYNNWFSWEGRFSGVLMAALQPSALFGNDYYFLTTYIILGGLVFGECYFAFHFLQGKEKKANKWLIFPIIAPVLIMQILYIPYAEETLYWYTGGINYMFSFAMSLVFVALYCKVAKKAYGKVKRVFVYVFAGIFALWIGGNNFGTSLSIFLLIFFIMIYFFVTDKKAFLRSFWLNIVTLVGLIMAVAAPANRIRMEANFGGGMAYGPLEAVWQSLYRSLQNVVSWTTLPVIILMLLILPFVWRVVKNMDFSFKVPGVFTVLTFGVYASQSTATLYTGGTTGTLRAANVLFVSYFVWLIANMCYWIGWIAKKEWIKRKISGKWLLGYLAIVGALLVSVIYAKDLERLTGFMAYRNLRQGLAQQYKAEWEERFMILEDESIQNPEFKPLSVQPQMLFLVDFYGEDDERNWVNSACATYYGKESIRLIE